MAGFSVSLRKRVAGVMLATTAVAVMGVGVATSAEAATLGTITNYAPGWVYNGKVPTRSQVQSTTHDGALAACRGDHPAAKDASLLSFTTTGSGGSLTVISKWACLG